MPLSKKEIRKLLAAPRGVVDKELSDRLFAEVVRLPDGRVIIKYGRDVVIWGSREEVLAILDRPPEAPKHILSDYARSFASPETFLEIRENVIALLSKELALPAEKLDFTFASLFLLDKRIRKKANRERIFVPILSYVGETFRHQEGGDWCFVPNENLGIVEPWFKRSNGGREALFIDVYKQLFEPKYRAGGLANCLPTSRTE